MGRRKEDLFIYILGGRVKAIPSQKSHKFPNRLSIKFLTKNYYLDIPSFSSLCFCGSTPPSREHARTVPSAYPATTHPLL